MRPMILSLGLIACLAMAHAEVLKRLRLNVVVTAPFTTPKKDGFLDIIAQEAFKRAGLHLTLIRLPAERALHNANQGIDDGDLFRIKGLDKIYPNLIQVPEPLYEFDFVAFTVNPTIKIRSWDDLKPYNVAIIRGWKILEHTIKAKDLTRVRSADLLFKMLKRHRVDVIVFGRWMGLNQAKMLGMKNIIVHLPPLATRDMFIYLNKKHRRYVEPLTNALRQIKKEGLYHRVYMKTLAPLISTVSQ